MIISNYKYNKPNLQLVKLTPAIDPNTPVTKTDAYSAFWKAFIQSNPDYAANFFTQSNLNNVTNIIKDSTLTAGVKFKKIFGFDLTQIANKTVSGLGDFFGDIGNFFNNLFSNENINNSLDFFRTGANQFQNQANILQYAQNQPDPNALATQQSQLFQYGQNVSNSWTSFMSSYGSYFLLGGGLLIVLLLMKK